MAGVSYRGVSRVYQGAEEVRAIDGLDLEIVDGEFLVLVGPSGSGKSTALRMLAGLDDVDEGTIHIGDRDVSHVSPRDRDIAMVFQSYALYPHMTVADNMGFALKLARVPQSEIRSRVRDTAELLELTPYLERRPKALSGGQRQRVAMGRAIIREPSVFLMDEPLSNLDAKLRVETRANIAALQQRLGTTTVYVTHDQVEAMTMGHRVAVLRDGRLQQCDTPRALYENPANSFVAGFIGSPKMNFRTARLVPGGAKVDDVVFPIERDVLAIAASQGLDTVLLGVRPEALRLARADEPGLSMPVALVEELGADAHAYGLPTEDTQQRFKIRLDRRDPPRLGDTLRITLAERGEVYLFHPVTDERL
jgi:multiple sugar transport system ATP-binding protein